MASKRSERFRGSRTRGRGKKAGRGAGMRGGRGNAGLHKHRFMWLLKNDRDHFGRHGFKRHKSISKQPRIINLFTLQDMLPTFLEKNLAKKRGDAIIIDLGKAGFDKLLSKGTVRHKLKIKVKNATANSIEKIEKAGGLVKLIK